MSDCTDEARTRDFVELIWDQWRGILVCIIAVGKLLIEAKGSVPHKQWLSLIKGELPFGPRTAQRLMRIATDWRITNAAHAPHLPPCWATLYELTKLSDEWFRKGLELGYIHPQMQRTDAEDLVRLSNCDDSDSDDDDADPVDRVDNQNLLDDARDAYLSRCKKLSARGRAEELKRCVDALIPMKGEQLLRKMERRNAAEDTELMIAESFNSVLDALKPSGANDLK